MRLVLAGEFGVEVGGSRVEGARLRGAQPRLVVGVLALERHGVTVDALAEIVWPQGRPGSWETALRAVVSRVRRWLGSMGLDEGWLPAAEDGRYRLVLPPGAVVDVVEAQDQVVDAEEALAAGDAAAAARVAKTACEVLACPLLAGVESDWVEGRRQDLRLWLLRGLEVRGAAALRGGDPAGALGAGEAALAVDGLRESAWRLVMRGHARAGNTAAALAAYERCREVLASELGTDPSAATHELHLELLRGQTGSGVRARIGWVPAPTSPLVGREAELAGLRELVKTERLVTVTGPGGVGKTRLVVELIGELVDQRADGVWFVDLAGVVEERAVAVTVLRTLGIVDDPALESVAQLCRVLAQRDALVVLDNCEHVVGAVASLTGAVLAAAPGVGVVATSRERLGVAGERVWPCPTLPTRPHGDGDDDDGGDGGLSPAGRLLVERAVAAGADPGGWDAGEVEGLCRRLDGLPLAIELAAARTRLLGPGEIAARLDERLEVLGAGPRTAHDHQRTVAATIAWSLGLLEVQERRLVGRLALFAGDFDVDAVEQVCVLDDVDRAAVLELLGGLVDRSLVLPVTDPAGGWFRLLVPVREHLRAQLDAGTVGRLRAALLGWLTARFTAGAEGLWGPEQAVWQRRLEHQREDVRVALRADAGDGLDAARVGLAAVAWHYWEYAGHLREGGTVLAELLDASDAGGLDRRAAASTGLAHLALELADLAGAAAAGERAVALADRTDPDPATLAAALAAAARPHRDRADVDRREAWARRAVDVAAAAGLAHHQAVALDTLASVLAYGRGDVAAAAAGRARAAELHEQCGDTRRAAQAFADLASNQAYTDAAAARAAIGRATAHARRLPALGYLRGRLLLREADVLLTIGEAEDAVRVAGQAIAVLAAGHVRDELVARWIRAVASSRTGRYGEAIAELRDVAARAEAAGDPRIVQMCHSEIAFAAARADWPEVAAAALTDVVRLRHVEQDWWEGLPAGLHAGATGRPDAAATLLAAAAANSQTLDDYERNLMMAAQAELRTRLGHDGYQAAVAHAPAMTLDDLYDTIAELVDTQP